MPRSGPRRLGRLRRRLAVVVATVAVITLGSSAPAAWAACEGNPPTPQAPDSGMAGWFVDPVEVDVDPENPEIPDPFADEGVGLVETYGYGYHWGTYDLGCGPDSLRDPVAISFSSIGNFVFDTGLAMGAAAQTAQAYVFDSPLNFLDGTVNSTQSAVFDRIWSVWFPITLMAVGLFLVIRARRAAFNEATQATLMVVVVLAASLYLLQWPVKAMTAADGFVTEGVALATSPFGNEPIEEQMARAIYYPAWLRGELGSDSSAAAEEYGPALFKAQHLSWAEVALYENVAPQTRDLLLQEKGTTFEELAAEIKEKYPSAYDHLTGRAGENRLGTAFVVLPFAASAALFVCLCMGLILLSMMIMRGFILAFPLVGIVGAHPMGRQTLTRLWDLLTAAVWNVIKFAFIVGIFLVVAGSLLSSDLNALAKIFFLIVLSVAVLAIARPFRSAKAMIPGLDPNRSYLGSAWHRFLDYRSTRVGTKEGVEDSLGESNDRATAKPGKERPTDRPRAEEESLPPLTTANSGYAVSGAGRVPHYDWDADPAGTQAEVARANARWIPDEAAAGPVRQEADLGGAGIGAAGAAGGAAAAASNGAVTRSRVPGAPAMPGARSVPASASSPTAGRHARHALGEPGDGFESGSVGSIEASGSPAPARSADPARAIETSRSASTRASDALPPPRATTIAAPTSYQVVDGEAMEPVYRRGDDTAPEPVGDLALSSPVIDEEGNEVHVIYQRERL